MTKKMIWIGLAVALLVFAGQPAAAQYDKAKVKATMQQTGALLKDIQGRADANDYFGAAEKLMDVAKLFKALDAVTPAKGDKKEWDRNHGAFVAAAFQGIGACGARDAAGLKKAVDELVKLRNEGHKMFR